MVRKPRENQMLLFVKSLNPKMLSSSSTFFSRASSLVRALNVGMPLPPISTAFRIVAVLLPLSVTIVSSYWN